MNADSVVFYDEKERHLEGSQERKADLFVEYDCVRYIKHSPKSLGEDFSECKNVFVCLPLNMDLHVKLGDFSYSKRAYVKDYNSRVYVMFFNKTHDCFECNCQGWQTRKRRDELHEGRPNCSHTLALFKCFKQKKFGGKKKDEI